jgi:16S rRNA processing protein RimM
MPKDLILIGQLGAPHGVRGHLRLKSYAHDPAAIANYEPLYDTSGLKEYAFAELRHVKGDMFVVKLKGISDRRAAEALTNTKLFVPRAVLPEPGEEEFYLNDLIGLEAIDSDGALIGQVKDILNFGAGDILEISPHSGGETQLYAFTKAIVPEIDLAAGRLVLIAPEETEARLPEENDEI